MLSIDKPAAFDRLYLTAILSRSAMGKMESGERRLALFDPLVYQHLRPLKLPPLGVLLEWSNRLNHSAACVSAGQDLVQLPVDPQDLGALTTMDDRPLAGWIHAAIPFRVRQIMYDVGIAQLPLLPEMAARLPAPWHQLDSVTLALADSIDELLANLCRLNPEIRPLVGVASRDRPCCS